MSAASADAPSAGLAPKAGVALRGREQQVLDVWILKRDPAPAKIA